MVEQRVSSTDLFILLSVKPLSSPDDPCGSLIANNPTMKQVVLDYMVSVALWATWLLVLYIYIYIYIYIYTHTHTHTYIHTYINIQLLLYYFKIE